MYLILIIVRYPTPDEKRTLAKKTGLTLTQVLHPYCIKAQLHNMLNKTTNGPFTDPCCPFLGVKLVQEQATKGQDTRGKKVLCLKRMIIPLKMIPLTMIPVIMMMPQRMRKHSVEKTRVSSKLVSVSPPLSPAFRIISTRSANYRCPNISSPHKFSSSFNNNKTCKAE